MNLKKALKLLRNKRAVNVVISSVILTCAVVAISFVVLVWAQSRSSSYSEQYGEAIDSDIAKLKERLTFEYVFYDNRSGNNLRVYIMNCGTIDDVTVQTVYVSNATWRRSFSNISLKLLNEAPTESLSRGSEGYFILSLPTRLTSNAIYYVKIITGRGSTFETTFIA